MRELLPICIVSLILAFLAERNSVFEKDEYGEKKYIRKDKLFFTLLIISMAFFVGLRTKYNDTETYTYGYEMMSSDMSVFQEIDWRLGSNPGFNFVNAIMRVLQVSSQNFLMIYSFVTITIYLWFLRKYTTNIVMTVFLFITMGCYVFTFAAIKQCIAVAFCLVATDYALKKKWGPFIIWILIASTFHPYAIMYALVPFLQFVPWTNRTFGMLMFFGLAGIGLESILGTMVSVTTMFGETYDIQSFSGEGVNVFRLAVVWVPVMVSLITKKYWRDSKQRNLFMNLTMLNAEIMFVALFGTANYFARLANYFLIFQTLSLPTLLKYFNSKSRKILNIGIFVGYLLYFCYANGIANGGFDYMYEGIGLLEYFKLLR